MKPSRFFIGKNTVIAIGLGKTKEDEIQDDIHKISACLKGSCGLFFTNKPKNEVIEWFNNYSVVDYARTGFKVKENFALSAGPLPDFSHAMEPYLRKLGLPTSLERGVVTLLKDYEVCKAGNVLTPEQAQILKLLDKKLATFRFNLKAVWTKGQGFEKLSKGDQNAESEDEGMDDDEEMEKD